MPEKSKGEAAAQAAAGAPQPSSEKPSSQPREYIVFRELDAEEIGLTEETLGCEFSGRETVLIALGTVDAKTPKEARRTVAKQKFDEEKLRGDGVPLRAITKSGATAGRGIAKLKVEPSWDD